MLEQERAAYAVACIEAVAPKLQAKYQTAVRKLPTMIMVNGLGQAIAFLKADAKNEAAQMACRQLAEWVIRRRHIFRQETGQPELLKLIISGDRETYLEAQDETLALLVWLKRLADAFFASSSGVDA